MRVAIVHDYIKEYGGAERVLEALCEIFPDAQVYTLIYLPSFLGPHKERFKKFKIHTSFLQYIPFNNKLISPIRIIAPLVFKTISSRGGPWDFSKFDVVIVSQTGAYIPNAINKKNAVQVCYSHTPPRYLYGYATARDWKKNIVLRVFGEIANHFLRLVDYKSAQNVDYFIANSKNIASRIKKFYRRSSKVIYPPATQDELAKALRAGPPIERNYYLAGGRIAKPKHIDLIVKTFEQLNLPLKIFGRGFANNNLKSLASRRSGQISNLKNVEYLGEVSDEEKYELMANAKAYVFASEDEDFGITPVEAMSAGVPIIAYRSGGVLETVMENKTGIFFDKLTVNSLKLAIERFLKAKFVSQDLIKQGQKFSKERFKSEIRDFVNKLKK